MNFLLDTMTQQKIVKTILILVILFSSLMMLKMNNSNRTIKPIVVMCIITAATSIFLTHEFESQEVVDKFCYLVMGSFVVCSLYFIFLLLKQCKTKK